MDTSSAHGESAACCTCYRFVEERVAVAGVEQKCGQELKLDSPAGGESHLRPEVNPLKDRLLMLTSLALGRRLEVRHRD